jgi:hypothetical protein
LRSHDTFYTYVGFSQIDNILNNSGKDSFISFWLYYYMKAFIFRSAVKSVRYEVFETIINMMSPIYRAGVVTLRYIYGHVTYTGMLHIRAI